jgi:hypothetical protein
LSGSAPITWESAQNGYVMTGCIPWDRVSAINISGAEIDAEDDNCRMYLTNNARDYIYYPWINGTGSGDNVSFNEFFDIVTVSTNKYKLTPAWPSINSSITHFALSLKGSGEDLIITFGDDSGGNTELTYKVTNNLTNVATSNTITSINSNGSYNATLSANDGYELSTVTVVMGGVDVTNSVYSNGNISISNVTGNIVITASANIIQSSGYTNMIPLSVALDGTPYNSGKGYKTGTRLSTSDQAEKVLEGMCVTGYIPAGHLNEIRIKNVTLASTVDGSTSYTALYGYNDLTQSAVNVIKYDDLNNSLVNGVITCKITNSQLKYIRLCCGKIDDTSIITINEEII